MNAHPALENHVNWLLNHSLQAGVLVLIVLAMQWIFRRQLTPRWRFALWWIVLVRLLLPFSLESALSLFNMFHANVRVEGPRYYPPAQTDVSAQHQTVPVSTSADLPAEKSVPKNANWAAPSLALSGPNLPAASPAAPAVSTAAASIPAIPKHSLSIDDFIIPGLAGLWLAGVLVLSGVVAVQVLRFSQKLMRIAAPVDEQLQIRFDECRREFGVARRIQLMETNAVQSPALFGLFRLRLLVPQRLGEQFTKRELRYIFLHELAHVKRGDLWLNWVVTGLQIMHWFNPLLWLGFARLRADRELACDELALLRAGDQAGTAYGETVVKLLENLSRPAAIPGLVGILEDTKQMRRRISMIANFRRPGRWSVLAVLLIAVMAAAALTDAQTEKTSSSRGNETQTASLTNSNSQSLLILAAATTKASIPPTNSAYAAETNTFQMTITVFDAQTGRGISGARVDTPYFGGLFQTNDPGRITDENGVAEIRVPKTFPDDRMQNFSINVSATNYPTRSAMWISDGGKVLATLPKNYTFRLEKGISVGGLVQDEHGRPVAGATVIPWGSGYRGFSMGTGQKFHQEFSEAPRYGNNGILTDERGFWQANNFPADLTAVRIDVVRPGGARSQFTTDAGTDRLSVEAAEPISLNDLLATNALLTLKDGYTIHGLVLDEAGKPVSGVRLKARGGQVDQTPFYVVTNQPDGRFEFDHWVVPQFVVTAEADGFATKTVVLSAADSSAERQIVLPSAKPLRVRVLGERGEPVAGAAFRVVDWRSGNQLVDWNGRTDANGVAVWTNAPDQPITIWVSATNYPVRAAKLLADGAEKVVQLRQGSDTNIFVRLRVSDADTGRLVPQFEVRRDLQWDQNSSVWGDPGTNGVFQGRISSSEFRLGTVDYFKLQIRAEGYQPWTGDDYYFDEGDLNLTVKLTKGALPAGLVRQPDGQSAVDAKVVLCASDGASVFFNAPNRSYPGRGSTTERTASDGTFHFIGANDDQYLVATHPSGFAATTVGELRRTKEIRLQAWASVEGVLRFEGKPVANEYVSVKAPMSWEALEGFNLVYSGRTDADGHFLFTNLPPSDYVLYQQPHIIYGVATAESHRWPFALKAGEHKQIDYSFGGRQLIGHVETEWPVDWQNDAQLLVLKTAQTPPSPPNYWAYVNKADYAKARKAYAHSPELQAYERQQQQFQLVFDNNGNFHADDVPPGNYELRLRVTRPPKNNNERFSSQRDELGSLTRAIEVSTGGGALDLGTIAMSVKPASDQSAEPAKPAELTAKDFDGHPVTLAQFKGKFVLLAFWAAWSDRCTEQLSSLAKMEKELGVSGKFAVLGVNLDEEAAPARQAIQARDYSWLQARLDNEGRARVAADFEITSLPSFCLIGPDGRVVAHGLTADLIQATVQRALKKQ